jgi:hypothetical protein
MPSFAFDCSTFAFDYATFAFGYASKGKRQRQKTQPLLLLPLRCIRQKQRVALQPLLVALQPLLVALQRQERQERQPLLLASASKGKRRGKRGALFLCVAKAKVAQRISKGGKRRKGKRNKGCKATLCFWLQPASRAYAQLAAEGKRSKGCNPCLLPRR